MDRPPDPLGLQGLRVHLVHPDVQESEVQLEVQPEAVVDRLEVPVDHLAVLVDRLEVPVDHLEVLVDRPEVPKNLPEVLEDHLGDHHDDHHVQNVGLFQQPYFSGLAALQGEISYICGHRHYRHMGWTLSWYLLACQISQL